MRGKRGNLKRESSERENDREMWNETEKSVSGV